MKSLRICSRFYFPVLSFLIPFFLFACATEKYVTMESVTISQVGTDKGVKTVVEEKTVRAAKNVIEPSTNVKSVTRVTDFKGARRFEGFDLSPDGKSLYMTIYEESSGATLGQVWSVAASGLGLTKVTSGKYMDLDPTCSTDGRYIYFSSNRIEKTPKIWRVLAGGTGGLTRVTTGATTDRSPHASPGGGDVAYAALMEGTTDWQIWTIKDNGCLPTQVTVGWNPVVSPDAKRILFLRKNPDTGKTDLWIMNFDGSSQTQITQGDADCATPRWSPDGPRIVFSCDKGLDEEGKNNFDVWIMNADGSNLTQLTTNGSYDDSPVFDKEGKRIYFRSNRGGSWDVWRMELAGE